MENRQKSWLLIVALLMTTVTFALADEWDDDSSDELSALLEDVGETYARGYLAPLISGFGINQNSGLYHTAAIPHTGLSISFAIKGMASEVTDADKTFSTNTSVDLLDFIEPGDPMYNQIVANGSEGVVVFEGPTVFGAEEETGTITGYWHGIPVFQETGIEALVDLDYVPTVTPEASIGGIYGLRGTIRWLPTYDAQDIGEIKYMGVGVSWTPNILLPTLPVDIAVGMFQQSLDVGDVLSSTASSRYIAVSKAFSVLTLYGGVASEESSMDVQYTQVDEDEEIDINFTLDGVQDKRTTIGATLSLGVKLNVEMNMGNMTNYSGGLIFGF